MPNRLGGATYARPFEPPVIAVATNVKSWTMTPNAIVNSTKYPSPIRRLMGPYPIRNAIATASTTATGKPSQ